MAGPVCKVIIDQQTRALSVALETILTNPSIHNNLIPEDERLALIQSIANVDIAAFAGRGVVAIGLYPANGLLGIVLRLEKYGLISDDVWKVLPRPATVGAKAIDGSSGAGPNPLSP